MKRRTRIRVVAFALIAVFLASIDLASFASAASSNAAGTGTHQTFVLDKRITPKRLDSYNFAAGFDYGNIVSVPSRHDGYNLGAGLGLEHTTAEQLNDARNFRSSSMPPPFLNARSTRRRPNSCNFATTDFNYTTGAKLQKRAK